MRLIKEIGYLNANDFNFKGFMFKRVPVAKHLIKKANLDKKTKFIINQILDQLAKVKSPRKKQNLILYDFYYRIDKRMQRNANLSNN